MDGFSQLMEPGKPMLPVKRFQILLPPGARAIAVDVVGFRSNDLLQEYDVLPFSGLVPLLGSPYLEVELTRLAEEWQANHETVYQSDLP